VIFTVISTNKLITLVSKSVVTPLVLQSIVGHSTWSNRKYHLHIIWRICQKGLVASEGSEPDMGGMPILVIICTKSNLN